LDTFLGLEKFGHVEEISRGLYLVVAEATHGFVRGFMAALGHVPARRLWTHENETANNHCREHGGGHHEAPIESSDTWGIRNIVEHEIGRVANHNTKCGPHLNNKSAYNIQLSNE